MVLKVRSKSFTGLQKTKWQKTKVSAENKGVRNRLLTFVDRFGIFHGSWDDQRERQMVGWFITCSIELTLDFPFLKRMLIKRRSSEFWSWQSSEPVRDCCLAAWCPIIGIWLFTRSTMENCRSLPAGWHWRIPSDGTLIGIQRVKGMFTREDSNHF